MVKYPHQVILIRLPDA